MRIAPLVKRLLTVSVLGGAIIACRGHLAPPVSTGEDGIHSLSVLTMGDASPAVFETDATGLPVYHGFASYVSSGQIRPFDAPGNPYLGEYGPIDDWIKANCRLLSDRHTGALWYDKRVTGVENYLLVDSSGFVVPAVRTKQLDEARLRAGVDLSSYRYLFAKGEMPAEINVAIKQARAAAMAGFFPPVPGWLAADPPAGGAILLPNGDVVVKGQRPTQPWSASASDRSLSHEGEDHSHSGGWHLYSNSGELLCADDLWQLHYRPDALDLMQERELDFEVHPGYLLLFDRKTHGFVKGYDYDGTELSSLPGNLTRRQFDLLSPELLTEIALVQ